MILAGNITPIDVITHIPILCEEKDIPYIYVPAKEHLGAVLLCPFAVLCLCSIVLRLPQALLRPRGGQQVVSWCRRRKTQVAAPFSRSGSALLLSSAVRCASRVSRVLPRSLREGQGDGSRLLSAATLCTSLFLRFCFLVHTLFRYLAPGWGRLVAAVNALICSILVALRSHCGKLCLRG
jgi:hypothetical protein